MWCLFFYRHVGPKGPKMPSWRQASRGTGPRAPVKAAVLVTFAGTGPRDTGKKRPPFTVDRSSGAPEPERIDGKKNAPLRRARACSSPSFAASDILVVPRDCSSGSPDPERARSGDLALQRGMPRVTVGRGPVPRHRPRHPTLAGDRPPRYGKYETPSD